MLASELHVRECGASAARVRQIDVRRRPPFPFCLDTRYMIIPVVQSKTRTSTGNTTRDFDVFPLLKLTQKQIERRNHFNRTGKAQPACEKQGDPNVNDYLTGKPSKFHMAQGDTGARLDGSFKNRREIKFGPKAKSPQWIRTTR